MRVSVYRDRYPTSFVVPRRSGHQIVSRLFLPFDKLLNKLDGIAWMAPFHNADLVHAFNRVPIGERKYVISFESHLPRRFGIARDNGYTDWLTREISSRHCRRVIALSHYARNQFIDQTKDACTAEALKAKLLVRHPNVLMGPDVDPLAKELANGRMDELVITFVGSHFARKGGCVAVRLAQKALEENLPVRIQIVSSLAVGASVWTDPTSEAFFKPYLDLLELPNVTIFNGLPNGAVRQMLGRSHFGFLPTFSDTFGYSIIEAMAEHTPSIATPVQAIPEFVKDGLNGLMLPLDVDELGHWIQPEGVTHAEQAYEEFFANEIEKLADHALEAIRPYIGKPEKLLPLRRAARLTAEKMFSPAVSGAFYDPFYERVAAEKLSTDPKNGPLDVSSPTISDIEDQLA
ncbi:MAG: glycosyltransferase family 4 protein [Hyphomonas sp.]|uniref:glycosyltransferase family 4 protein n=1 Tax=Hyphomonas sp. TaxID=87 RepID=UPI0030029D0B